jgi:hypothetical protein
LCPLLLQVARRRWRRCQRLAAWQQTNLFDKVLIVFLPAAVQVVRRRWHPCQPLAVCPRWCLTLSPHGSTLTTSSGESSASQHHRPACQVFPMFLQQATELTSKLACFVNGFMGFS